MTTPRGKAPQKESNGHDPAAPARKARRAQAAEKHENLTDPAAQLTVGAEAAPGPSPFAGLGPGEAIAALRFLGQQAVREPLTLMQDTPGAARELLRIALGKSQLAPEKGDKRFADPAWRENPLYRRAMQTYLYYGSRSYEQPRAAASRHEE